MENFHHYIKQDIDHEEPYIILNIRTKDDYSHPLSPLI